MGWRDIYSEGGIARADRLVTAMMGTFTNPGNEILGQELDAVLREIDADDDEHAGLRVIASLTTIAYLAISRLGQLRIEEQQGSVDLEDLVAARNAEMAVLREFVEFVDELRRTDMLGDPDGS